MIVAFSNVIHFIVKAAVFTITYSLKIKFDLKQFQKTTMKTWKLVSPRPWIGTIQSRHACDCFDLFITITGIEGGGGGGGAFDKKIQELLLHPILSSSTGDDLMILLIG